MSIYCWAFHCKLSLAELRQASVKSTSEAELSLGLLSMVSLGFAKDLLKTMFVFV